MVCTGGRIWSEGGEPTSQSDVFLFDRSDEMRLGEGEGTLPRAGLVPSLVSLRGVCPAKKRKYSTCYWIIVYVYYT